MCVCVLSGEAEGCSLESMNGVHDREIASCAIQYHLTAPVLSQTIFDVHKYII